MKLLHLVAAGAAIVAMSAPADAQSRPVSGARITYPSHSNHFSWERGHRFRGAFPVLVVEHEVPVIVEREVAPPPPPAPPLKERGEKERKPYVVGATYASLPGGCMKLIEAGGSFFYCGDGEWYREVRAGRDPLYRAVARTL